MKYPHRIPFWHTRRTLSRRYPFSGSFFERLHALYFTLLCLAAVAGAMFDRFPAMLNAAGADAVVIDSSHFHVELVPMCLCMPYVHVSNWLHFDYSGYTPLCVYDWPHDSTPEALVRNRKRVARFRKMLSQTHAGAGAYAKRVGLKIDWENPYATISKLAWLMHNT